MLTRILLTLFLFLSFVPSHFVAYAEDTGEKFNKLRTIDIGTFNEFKYKLTEQLFELRNIFEIDQNIDEKVAKKMLDYVKKGYEYLPDNLDNKNYYNKVKTALERGIKYPSDDGSYNAILETVVAYMENTAIDSIKGKVEAYPKTGNAPLTVTFRGNVKDPTGTSIPKYNYIWWMDDGGKRKIISKTKGRSLNYTFREEGNFSMFLDVVSSHKNSNGNIDVLPFRSRADITVKEKVASMVIKINGVSLRQRDEIKFSPEESVYGLLFDASSSTPTSGTKFVKTEWDFGNGVKKEYAGAPKIERVIYNKEGQFKVTLKLKTNEGKTVERIFYLIINNPIATIKSSLSEGYLGDTFTFSAQNQINDENLSYSWEVIDTINNVIIHRKSGNLMTYTFQKKGAFNVQLKVTEPSSNTPDIDTKLIYINSRAPEADFKHSIPFKHKPNTVLLDASRSYDPDYSDDGNLKFSWNINGQRVVLDEPNYNGSVGYYTFDSISDHSVVLEVTDPDGITVQEKKKVQVRSLLSVEFSADQRVIPRKGTIEFIGESQSAVLYEWSFGDGNTYGGEENITKHRFEESGIFPVQLKVIDENDQVNTYSQNIYVSDSESPYAFINVEYGNQSEVMMKENLCNGEPAYILNRVDLVSFSGEESIDITGKTFGLDYSWKLGKDAYFSDREFSQKFEDLGCTPLQLKVTSKKNGKSHTTRVWLKVENIAPRLSSIDVKPIDPLNDPVVVKVNALGAKDRDGIIQSYLWYYYTDIDPEPQDFRATKLPSTTFVLPKVTGKYYFVVLMQDNNETRVSSEDITGSKYFITLTGDNINIPLITLKSDKTSVSIGEEVTFIASAENILGQNLTKKAKYSWDLDGDGFYELNTTLPTTTYTYTASGEFHPKVKVKYKGFSNTKSITLGVANLLKPDFKYISIGPKYLLLDQTYGKYDSIMWKLGDGNTIEGKSFFIHNYEDGKNTHNVELFVSEGEKTRIARQEIKRNMKNQMLVKKAGGYIFSYPAIEDDTIILDKEEQVYLYVKFGKSEGKTYILDADIENDSDLNGGNDDDRDLKGNIQNGFSDILSLPLNKNREQFIQISAINEQGQVIEEYRIKIGKQYIANQIDPSTLVFQGVSPSERVKIEELKDYVNTLPKQHKLKALMYVQKLQEEWFDEREKTNVILEFEGFIQQVDTKNFAYATELLESLLVEGQEDKSEKAIVLNALKNLIPQEIQCFDEIILTVDQKCYEVLGEKLEVIRDNTIIEENRALGKQILNVVAKDTTMTNAQKQEFKAILKTLVYGGVDQIPVEEKQEVLDETTDKKDILGLLKIILFWIFAIIGIFLLVTLTYYIYYKLVNKNPHIGFQDFIIEKTSGKKPKAQEKETNSDILDDMNDEIQTGDKNDEVISPLGGQEDNNNIAVSQDDVSINPFIHSSPPIEGEKSPLQSADNINIPSSAENKAIEGSMDASVPDWLHGSFESSSQDSQKTTDMPENTPEDPQEVNLGSIGESDEQKNNSLNDVQDISLQEAGQADAPEGDIPDWLQGSLSEKQSEEPKKRTTEIPDWLQSSFASDEKSESEPAIPESEPAIKEEANNTEAVAEKKPSIEPKKTIENIQEEESIQNKKEDITQNQKQIQKTKKVDIDKQDDIKKQTTTKKDEKSGSKKKQSTPKKSTTSRKKTEKTSKAQEKNNDQTPTKQKIEGEKKTVSKKKSVTKTQKDKGASQENPEKTNSQSDESLWSDGMDIPDWLKTDQDK